MKMYNIIYINQDKTTEIKVKNGVPYIVFKNLELPGILLLQISDTRLFLRSGRSLRQKSDNFWQISDTLYLSDIMQPCLHILFLFFSYYNARY